jgi:hypothetical protein
VQELKETAKREEEENLKEERGRMDDAISKTLAVCFSLSVCIDE